MNTDRLELTGVAGVPESALAEAFAASLPVSEAPAPWDCRCTGLLWLGRGGRAARAALPPALRSASALGSVGGFVRYEDTPVGTYDEVFGIVAAREGRSAFGSVAFMSVDSRPSLVGGRTNWAMPKTLADFTGSPAGGMSGTSSEGVRWSVAATPRAFGPAVPVKARSTARQEFAGGRVGVSPLTCRGRVRLAVVTVEVESEGPLPGWLRPGRHLGAVVEEATFTLGEPRFTD